VEIVLSLIRKRFGRIPPAVGQRIAALKPTQLKRVAMRLLDAQRIEVCSPGSFISQSTPSGAYVDCGRLDTTDPDIEYKN
jgi:hypothetical protein